MKTIKVRLSHQIPKDFTGIVEYEDSVKKEWRKEGLLHREDGPAIEYADGDKHWHKNGSLHREDGPAVEYLNGHKEWHKEGKLHREDGPAIEHSDGTKEWWIEYVEYYEEVLQNYINTCIALETKSSNGGTYWIKFLCEDGIKKYPYIPGMNVDISSVIK